MTLISDAGSVSFTSNSNYKVYPLPPFLTGKSDDFDSIKEYLATDTKDETWKEDNKDWSTYRYIDLNAKYLKEWFAKDKKGG